MNNESKNLPQQVRGYVLELKKQIKQRQSENKELKKKVKKLDIILLQNFKMEYELNQLKEALKSMRYVETEKSGIELICYNDKHKDLIKSILEE